VSSVLEPLGQNNVIPTQPNERQVLYAESERYVAERRHGFGTAIRFARGSPNYRVLHGHFATSFLIVLALRIVKGSLSAFSNGTVENTAVPGFLRRHQ